MQGTGSGDILIEAGLISGSLYWVLTGKQYSRAIRCHKTMLEALERLLLMELLISSNRSSLMERLENEQVDLIQELLENPSRTSVNVSRTNETVMSLVQEYADFKESIQKSEMGKTARLWMSDIDHIWLILADTSSEGQWSKVCIVNAFTRCAIYSSTLMDIIMLAIWRFCSVPSKCGRDPPRGYQALGEWCLQYSLIVHTRKQMCGRQNHGGNIHEAFQVSRRIWWCRCRTVWACQ